MDEEQQQPQSEESRGESALLKLQEEFHQFIQECRDCRREIECALAILRPLRDTVGHALPRLRQPVAPARCACLPPVWRGITTGPALRPGHEARLPLSFYRLY